MTDLADFIALSLLPLNWGFDIAERLRAGTRAGEVFDGPRRREEPPVDVKAMHAKIGELALENDFLSGALDKAGLLSAKR